MSVLKFNEYPERLALAQDLALKVSDALKTGIVEKGSAMLAVSGGSTPKAFFQALSKMDLEWDKIIITLVDERWVGEDDERSNGRLLRSNLLINKAAAAQFHPLYSGVDDVDDALDNLVTSFKKLPLPFDAVVLGMGNDGHTASFFPGGDNLAAAIDPASNKLLASMRADGAGEPRITFTLPVLTAARFLALHIEGAEKKTVYDRALEPGDVLDMPIRSILQSAKPLEIFWTA